jgi:predicted lipoprotein with Yx(FWY)xxD motif
MQRHFTHAAVIAAILSATTGAFAQTGTPAMIGDTAKGKTLVDPHGMTLYVFDKDMNGRSASNGPCATSWPPLLAPPYSHAMGEYTVIKRDDGKAQWAYKGRPLYTWSKDQKPGDITGDGFLNNAWHAATP